MDDKSNTQVQIKCKENLHAQEGVKRRLEITCSGTSPLGHLYSRDKVSIQGTQNLVPEKRPHNLCIYYLF